MSGHSTPYRDGKGAVRARLEALRVRVGVIDGQLACHGASLSPTLQRRLAELRRAADPAGDSAHATLCAERAAAELEQRLDEDLGLVADLHRSVNPVLPPTAVGLRWAAMSVLASTILVGGVVLLGFGDFMLQAFGVKVLRANATMPCDRFSFEAERAARGGEPPDHAQWVDPQP